VGGESGDRDRGRNGARILPAFLGRAARVGGRALAFAYFALLALSVGFLVIPAERMRASARGAAPDGGPAGEELLAQRALHRASRRFVRLLERLHLARVRQRDTELLGRRPLLVVSNHPSLIDTPLLLSCMPQADLVVNRAWRENPVLRKAVAGAGYLRAEEREAVVQEAVARLRAGRSVVIYPEGSRTPAEGLRRFQRGAAHIALEAGCDVVPVVIQVRPRTLVRGQRWADVPDGVPEWRIEVGAPIRAADHLDGTEPRPVAARRLTAVLQDYFEKRWERGDG
jgi:1-acyl-sn-glycerol-3-phosphate acyltransferase